MVSKPVNSTTGFRRFNNGGGHQNVTHAIHPQVCEFSKMKKQMATLMASINTLLKDKGYKSDNEERHIEGMQVPRFTSKNPSTWIFMANQFFEHHQTPIWDRISIVVFHMKGEALNWFHEVEGY